MSIIEGTPADITDLVVGDRIIAIDGEPTFSKELSEIVSVLRGEEGAGVTIKIERPGMEEPFDQPITRARIDIPSVQIPGEVNPISLIFPCRGSALRDLLNAQEGSLQRALVNSLNNGATGII